MNSNEYMSDNGGTPVIPLSDPGESSPVFPGNSFTTDTDANGNTNVTPILPLPTSSEGSTVLPTGDTNMGRTPGDTMNMPGSMNPNMSGSMNPNMPGGMNINMPDAMNPNMSGSMNANMPGAMNPNMPGSMNANMPGAMNPNMPGSMNPNMSGGMNANLPGIPLPAPGEGSTVFSGNNSSGFQGTIITVLPRPVTPCFYCNSSSYGTIRFFNAAVGYTPFVISINNRTVVDALAYAEVSGYGRTSSGFQTVTIAGQNGHIYVSRQVRVTVGSTMTIAIVNTTGGLDFTEINDAVCFTPLGGSCVRACNLSYNAGPLTLSTYSGNIVFSNVGFMEVTNYIRVVPAHYDIFVSNTNEALLSTEITVRSGSQYTIYMFNWTESPTAIRTLVIEDRRSF